MKLQILSDVHTEMLTPSEIETFPLVPSADCLALLGDIGCFAQPEQKENFRRFLTRCIQLWKHVYLVPGNHECYGFSIDRSSALLHQFCAEVGPQISVLEQDIVLYPHDLHPLSSAFSSLPRSISPDGSGNGHSSGNSSSGSNSSSGNGHSGSGSSSSSSASKGHTSWMRKSRKRKNASSDTDEIHVQLAGENNGRAPIVLLGLTLWSRILDSEQPVVEKAISDYRMISGFSVALQNSLHAKAVTWLSDRLAECQRKGLRCVVLTHHAPLPPALANHPLHACNGLASAFCTDLVDLIRRYGASGTLVAWAWGHTHHNVDVNIAGCRCVTNQVGYRGPAVLHRPFVTDVFLDVPFDTK
jgi:hypothetical protein